MPTLHSNGITLAYEVSGSGYPLLLISGIGYGGWYWRRLAPELSRDFQVITFDNRGTGDSDKPAGPYTTRLLAEDTLGLMAALGITSAYVFGHSMGSFVAQEVALAQPDRVRKLVLGAATYGGPNAIPITPQALRVLTDRSGDPLDLFRRGVAVSTAAGFAERRPEVVEELWRYRSGEPVPPAQYAAQVMAGAQHDAEARIGELRCPTLILFGAEDQVVPPGNAGLLAKKIANSQVRILPGVGHHFPLEDAERTIAVLRAFLT